MQKIISLFLRDYEGNRQVVDALVPGAEWVVAGEGIATVQIDGTCCLIRDGKLLKRYDVKKGKTPPADFEPAQEPDALTLIVCRMDGSWPGWVPVGKGPEDQWHREGLRHYRPSMHTLGDCYAQDGTCELIGPKVQENPYGMAYHRIIGHGHDHLFNVPTDFEGVKAWLGTHPQHEGIVWHHPDGRMVKIKRRDFGMIWPLLSSMQYRT